VVFGIAMLQYLPEYALRDINFAADQQLQKIAYTLNFSDYEQWATTQGYSVEDARGIDTGYYASRGRLGAGVGVQRGGHLSAAGVHRIVPGGLGKLGHMRAAATLQHPYDADARTELDIAYAAYRIAELAPTRALHRMRAAKTLSLQQARALLVPAERALHKQMMPTVRIAAAAWQVLLIAYMACVMHWRDTNVARRFLEGCRILERLPRTNLYRPRRVERANGLKEYLAGNNIAAYERKCRITEDTPEIHDSLMEEVPKGFALPPQPASYYDAKYGPQCWRALVRWIHEQPNGKRRPIDDAKWGEQNAATEALEKLHCIGIDFGANTLKCLFHMIWTFFAPQWRHVPADAW